MFTTAVSKKQGRNDRPIKRKRGRRGAAALFLLAALLLPPIVPHLRSDGEAARLDRPVDAIFILSGGQGRIQEGFREWSSGAARELYVLGAGGNLEPVLLIPAAAAMPEDARNRIHVEGWSENTLENAFSAKFIVGQRRFTSVILVTSDYHVPRAYLAFRRILPPTVSIGVIPVPSEDGSAGGVAWRWARRHFLEGWKYWGYRVLLRWE